MSEETDYGSKLFFAVESDEFLQVFFSPHARLLTHAAAAAVSAHKLPVLDLISAFGNGMLAKAYLLFGLVDLG